MLPSSVCLSTKSQNRLALFIQFLTPLGTLLIDSIQKSPALFIFKMPNFNKSRIVCDDAKDSLLTYFSRFARSAGDSAGRRSEDLLY